MRFKAKLKVFKIRRFSFLKCWYKTVGKTYIFNSQKKKLGSRYQNKLYCYSKTHLRYFPKDQLEIRNQIVLRSKTNKNQ